MRQNVSALCPLSFGYKYKVLETNAQKPVEPMAGRAFEFNPGNDLVSHTIARAVPSAQRGLTSVFGMGTGVTLSVRSPETCESLTTQY